MGNLASVKNAFSLLGEEVVVESDPDKLGEYDKLILPGVGAFGDAMQHLEENGMDEAVTSYAKSGNYMLGICLGMQLLFDSSEEFGSNKGLGLIPGKIVGFDEAKFSHPLKVPHMGWNRMFTGEKHSGSEFTKEHPLFEGMDQEHYLYFVHSFHAVCAHSQNSIGETEYGYRFSSSVQKDNILGIQPHPEKSHKNGLAILKNFINL